jgi:hypothetical protein
MHLYCEIKSVSSVITFFFWENCDHNSTMVNLSSQSIIKPYMQPILLSSISQYLDSISTCPLVNSTFDYFLSFVTLLLIQIECENSFHSHYFLLHISV